MASSDATLLPLGTPVPPFALPDTAAGAGVVSHADFAGAPALVVMFLCNHCPYVKHVRAGIAAFARDAQARGVGVVGICSNDAARYPEDSPARMREEAVAQGYSFPYLYDESQAVAQAYGAACTPEFFLFDGAGRLAYHGRFDDSRPGTGQPVTGAELRAALDAVLSGRPVAGPQHASIGCGIKWRPGNVPSGVSV
jgi:peroxiredoxin